MFLNGVVSVAMSPVAPVAVRVNDSRLALFGGGSNPAAITSGNGTPLTWGDGTAVEFATPP